MLACAVLLLTITLPEAWTAGAGLEQAHAKLHRRLRKDHASSSGRTLADSSSGGMPHGWYRRSVDVRGPCSLPALHARSPSQAHVVQHAAKSLLHPGGKEAHPGMRGRQSVIATTIDTLPALL